MNDASGGQLKIELRGCGALFEIKTKMDWTLDGADIDFLWSNQSNSLEQSSISQYESIVISVYEKIHIEPFRLQWILCYLLCVEHQHFLIEAKNEILSLWFKYTFQFSIPRMCLIHLHLIGILIKTLCPSENLSWNDCHLTRAINLLSFSFLIGLWLEEDQSCSYFMKVDLSTLSYFGTDLSCRGPSKRGPLVAEWQREMCLMIPFHFLQKTFIPCLQA